LTGAKEIGAQWKVSRCVIAMRKPGFAYDQRERVLQRGWQARRGARAGKKNCDHSPRLGNRARLARSLSPTCRPGSDLQAIRESFDAIDGHFAPGPLLERRIRSTSGSCF